MSKEEENSLYARWLSGNLSPEESSLLAQNGEEQTLRQIVDSVDTWSLPAMKKAAPDRKNAKAGARVVPLYRQRLIAALAASLALIIASYWFFTNANAEMPPVALNCSAGQVKGFILPDSTIVILSGNSQLSFNAGKFLADRQLQANGEVSFDVRRKGPFCASFKDGNIKVLGTKFILLSAGGFSSVKCYEGKVEVNLGTEKYFLGKGKGVRKNGTTPAENYDLPGADFSQSSLTEKFSEAPLSEVCASISAFFSVKFQASGVNLNRNFTGVYKKTSLDSALLMVFEPMGIKYRNENGSVVLSNQ
jgi:ferric-dicitrate binding protein FerR (iron transport regulator)